jgi:hypothetical protein
MERVELHSTAVHQYQRPEHLTCWVRRCAAGDVHAGEYALARHAEPERDIAVLSMAMLPSQ